MTQSAQDCTPLSTRDSEKAGSPSSSIRKPQDAVPEQSWAQRVGREVIAASIRMRTEPELREAIQKKTH